ncbi:hypothetical protein [Streptomyces sp. G-G2]|uniref:hypothetical protein n=1 Tax=Streptomyces sp. G-G2 TaxID=3046201 RepID=UPI0024B94B17|nr:hypothetical protein [Streptomyces sp. G-G2]MDJ0383526.1 hypothetical protein [Streptomyces sp. G-G2]
MLHDLVEGPRGLRQRAAGLALFAQSSHDGPAAEIARVHRSDPRPPASRPATRRRGRPQRLAATTAAACAVWACAVGTGLATTHDGPALMRALDHGLDPDRLAPGQGHAPEGHHS